MTGQNRILWKVQDNWGDVVTQTPVKEYQLSLCEILRSKKIILSKSLNNSIWPIVRTTSIRVIVERGVKAMKRVHHVSQSYRTGTLSSSTPFTPLQRSSLVIQQIQLIERQPFQKKTLIHKDILGIIFFFFTYKMRISCDLNLLKWELLETEVLCYFFIFIVFGGGALEWRSWKTNIHSFSF